MLSFIFYGCQEKKIIPAQKISVDIAMLDSVKRAADTTYTKKYPRTDLVLAEYYINHKDSTTTQLMKDNNNLIRQIIISKNKTRIYFATFYPNGQLIAKYKLDNFGQYTDSSKEYYENGFLKATGIYKNGFHLGVWKNYDSTGNYINAEEYDTNGQQIKIIK